MSDDQLAQYRQSIDNKAQAGMPAADPGREAQQVKRLRNLAEEAGLDPEFSEKFLRFIIDEVIHHHERIAEEPS